MTRTYTVTLAELADMLALDPGDVRVIVEQLGDDPDAPLDAAQCGFLRGVFDPHGERTAPAALYWPGAAREELPDPDAWPGTVGLSPTRGEGPYPPLA